MHAAPREEARDPLHVEVTSGATIYMPAGTPHAARAQDVLSGHLTVGVHVTPWREVLTGVVGRVAAEIDEPVAAGWTDDVEGFADELRGRLAALASALGEVDVRTEAGERRERFLSNRAQLARGTISERSAPISVDDATVVARRPGTVCELAVRTDRLVVLLGDRRLEMPALAGASDAPGCRPGGGRRAHGRRTGARPPRPGRPRRARTALDPRGVAHDPRRSLSAPVPSIGDRCSLRSLAADEPLAGTASTIRHWLLIEHPGPWGRDGLLDARMPDGLGKDLRALERRTGARVLLIRKPGRIPEYDDGTVLCFAVDTQEAWMGFAGLGRIEDALRIDPRDPSSLPGDPEGEPLFVVCTHGRRDPCCAERGRPLAQGLAASFPDVTWESTHVGGDRFAANLVAFPHGLYFGRVEPDEGPEIVRGVRRGPDRAPRPLPRPGERSGPRPGGGALPPGAPGSGPDRRRDARANRPSRRSGRGRLRDRARVPPRPSRAGARGADAAHVSRLERGSSSDVADARDPSRRLSSARAGETAIRAVRPRYSDQITIQRSTATPLPELAARCVPSTTIRTVCDPSASPSASRTVANVGVGA